MHPIVRDEVYRIGDEATRNAYAHSGGHRLTVTLRYAHDLVLQIADDGTGIDPDLTRDGRPGHFGLQGMRERSTRIGAKLSIESAPGAGTHVVLVVPGRVVFRHRPSTLYGRVKAAFRRT
jgi:signal transduction histidine kinase